MAMTHFLFMRPGSLFIQALGIWHQLGHWGVLRRACPTARSTLHVVWNPTVRELELRVVRQWWPSADWPGYRERQGVAVLCWSPLAQIQRLGWTLHPILSKRSAIYWLVDPRCAVHKEKVGARELKTRFIATMPLAPT
jgi:hypothetical protein